MKKLVCLLCIATLTVGAAFAVNPKKKGVKRTVTFETSIECENCAKKVTENISFEKGVWDLKVDVPTQTVTIVFDDAKSDTTALANAIRKLGYDASVKEYK